MYTCTWVYNKPGTVPHLFSILCEHAIPCGDQLSLLEEQLLLVFQFNTPLMEEGGREGEREEGRDERRERERGGGRREGEEGGRERRGGGREGEMEGEKRGRGGGGREKERSITRAAAMVVRTTNG